MSDDLELPDVGELTFPQWRDWLAQYNKFIGERDVRYAAGLRERDDRIEKLEAALREIAADFGTVSAVGTMDALYSAAAILAERISIARKALEGKDDVN